jgi:hypothetical protein
MEWLSIPFQKKRKKVEGKQTNKKPWQIEYLMEQMTKFTARSCHAWVYNQNCV